MSFMLAAWAAVYRLKAVLIDARADLIPNGNADGLQSRTLEIMHSFGFGDVIYKNANRLQEICFWVRRWMGFSAGRSMLTALAFCRIQILLDEFDGQTGSRTRFLVLVIFSKVRFTRV
jgi:2-polyprenyl-6-methoxyphenol hydroxylase-like FAD-dependent oxidoreductase